MSYDNWRRRLALAQLPTVAARRAAVAALKINFSQPGEADEGYYRKPITEKHPSGNGQNVITGWVPVSYYMWPDQNGKLEGCIGAGDQSRNMTPDEVGDEELWSWVVSNPINYETYQSVVEFGDPWPDQLIHQNEADNRSAASNADKSPSRATVAGDALPSEQGHARTVATISNDHNKPPELLPHVEHANAIDNAIGAAKDLKVTTVQEAAIAAGAANILRDRRLAAEKAGKIKVEPLKLAYETERNNWLPPVQRAKAFEDGLRKMVSEFEIAERKRVIKEQQEALEKQRELDEANARAADRAIAAGLPEQPPVVEEVAVIPQAPERVQPTYGNYKPAAKPLRKFAVITDDVAVYKYFANTADMKDMLQRFATHAVRQGVEVPGTTFREGTE